MNKLSSVFITGTSGFLGSQLALHLAHQGYRVIGLVKDKNYRLRKDIIDKISITYGDLCDYDAVRHCISRYEIDTIFHVAATTIVKQSVIDPISTYRSNVLGTVNILEAARQAGKQIKKIVVASSDKAMGDSPKLPYTEDSPMLPSDPYSTSKACTDLIARSFAMTYDMNISVVRCGNIYGPGDLNLSRLIPGSILRLLNNEAPTIYSGVGEFKREWVYIDDVINAYLTVCDRGGQGEAYNVGETGFNSIFETVDMVRKACGSDIKPIIVDKHFIEIKNQWLDAAKLRSLGWKYNYSLEQGLAKTVPWYKDFIINKSGLFFGWGN